MEEQTYEAPALAVLGGVAELTEQKGGGQSDQAGLDGGGSFEQPK